MTEQPRHTTQWGISQKKILSYSNDSITLISLITVEVGINVEAGGA